MKKLLLFDIDGTLIITRAGVAALSLGLRDAFDIDDDFSEIETAGVTEGVIARSALAKHGIESNTENIAHFHEAYLRHLAEMIPQREARLLPGVLRLLEELRRREDVVLALLTGNLERGAQIKLEHVDAWRFFEFGAYSDDHHDRNHLGHVARTRAGERHGITFESGQIFIIGDTPHDIACGKSAGARTIAVATGRYSAEELRRHAPDFLFESFEDHQAVIRAIDA